MKIVKRVNKSIFRWYLEIKSTNHKTSNECTCCFPNFPMTRYISFWFSFLWYRFSLELYNNLFFCIPHFCNELFENIFQLLMNAKLFYVIIFFLLYIHIKKQTISKILKILLSWTKSSQKYPFRFCSHAVLCVVCSSRPFHILTEFMGKLHLKQNIFL